MYQVWSKSEHGKCVKFRGNENSKIYQKIKFFRGGVKNFKMSQKTHLGNVVKNKCTKFGQNRSTGRVLNFGGKKSREKEKEEKKCVLDPKMAFFEQS